MTGPRLKEKQATYRNMLASAHPCKEASISLVLKSQASTPKPIAIPNRPVIIRGRLPHLSINGNEIIVKITRIPPIPIVAKMELVEDPKPAILKILGA